MPSTTLNAITGWRLRYLLAGALLATNARADSISSAGQVHILWTEPADIAQRDLFYGIGGIGHAPQGTTFKFLSEDRVGSSPKFDVQDPSGVIWKVKGDVEARPETAATGLVWAVGYRTDEDYFLPQIQVSGLPARLPSDNVRLERADPGLEKVGMWRWKDGPLAGTREWNGLRVLMALINNWDLKDNNNGVFTSSSDPGQRIYMITDLGASFGANGIGRGHLESRGNLASYQASRFITNSSSDRVDFATPDKATARSFFILPHYIYRLKLRWLGKDIPREDAKWMGQLLARLSKKQIRDAFRAAGYESDTAEAFAQVVESRIAALNAL